MNKLLLLLIIPLLFSCGKKNEDKKNLELNNLKTTCDCYDSMLMLKEQIYPIWENSNKRNNWLDLLHKEQYDDLVILWEQLLKVEKYCNDFVPFPPLEESLRMYESCESVKKYENMKEHLGANFYKGIEKIKRENYEDDPW